jgi:hypothetical protein
MLINSVVAAVLLAVTIVNSSAHAQPCFNDTAAVSPTRPSSVCDAFSLTATAASYVKNETRQAFCTAAGCTWSAANGNCDTPADESTVSCGGLTSLLACHFARCSWTNPTKALQFSPLVEAVAESVETEVSVKVNRSTWASASSDALLVHAKPASSLYTNSLMLMNRTGIRALATCDVAAVLDAQRIVVCAPSLVPVLKFVRFSADFATVAQWVVGYDAAGAEPIVSPFEDEQSSGFALISYKGSSIGSYWRVPLTVTANDAEAPTLGTVESVPLPALPAANSTGVIEFVSFVGSTSFWAFRSDAGVSSSSQFMVNDTKVLEFPGSYTYNKIVHYCVAGGVAYIFHRGIIEAGFGEMDGNDEVFVVNGQAQAFRAGRVPLNWESMGLLPYIRTVSTDTNARKFLFRIREDLRTSPTRNASTVLEWNWCPGTCSSSDVENWDRTTRIAAVIEPSDFTAWGWTAAPAESTVGSNNATLVAGCKLAKPAGEKCPCPCHICQVAETASAQTSTRLACVVDVGACIKRPDGLFSKTTCDADTPLPTSDVGMATSSNGDTSTTSTDSSTTFAIGPGGVQPTARGEKLVVNAVLCALALTLVLV